MMSDDTGRITLDLSLLFNLLSYKLTWPQPRNRQHGRLTINELILYSTKLRTDTH
jgi:hypothetical protein